MNSEWENDTEVFRYRTGLYGFLKNLCKMKPSFTGRMALGWRAKNMEIQRQRT